MMNMLVVVSYRVRFECQTKTLTYFECQTQGSSVRLTLTHWFECQTNSKFESYTRTVSGGQILSGSSVRLKRRGARVNFQVQDTLLRVSD